MIKRILMGWLIKLLDRSVRIDYKKINRSALEDWCYDSFDNPGWKSYVAYEDLRILKEMSFGKDRDAYMVLMGRRLQLLYLADEMRKSFENKKSNEEKRKAAAELAAKKDG